MAATQRTKRSQGAVLQSRQAHDDHIVTFDSGWIERTGGQLRLVVSGTDDVVRGNVVVETNNGRTTNSFELRGRVQILGWARLNIFGIVEPRIWSALCQAAASLEAGGRDKDAQEIHA